MTSCHVTRCITRPATFRPFDEIDNRKCTHALNGCWNGSVVRPRVQGTSERAEEHGDDDHDHVAEDVNPEHRK